MGYYKATLEGPMEPVVISTTRKNKNKNQITSINFDQNLMSILTK